MINDRDDIVSETLCRFIKLTDDDEIKYALAEARYELVSEHSPLGAYCCSIKPPFSNNVQECDICLEDELYELWKQGIHTISSCCGHGRVAPYIQVLSGDSAKKMNDLGYVKIKNDVVRNKYPAYRPKTYLPCFSLCRECKSFNTKTNTCVAKDYSIEMKWCFRKKSGL